MADDDKGLLGGGRNRRGFLGLIGKLGLGAVGAGAALAGTATPAFAAPACCYLAYQPGSAGYCRGDGSGGFICPSGYHWETWYCCASGRRYACAECTTGRDCYASGIKCSAYWTVANNCTSAVTAESLEPRMDAKDLARWNAKPWGPPVTKAELAHTAPLHLNTSGPHR